MEGDIKDLVQPCLAKAQSRQHALPACSAPLPAESESAPTLGNPNGKPYLLLRNFFKLEQIDPQKRLWKCVDIECDLKSR